MAHFVVESDAQGNVLDYKVYCSDSCARTNPSYGGWFGAQEVEFTTYCSNEVCNELIKGIRQVLNEDDNSSGFIFIQQ